MGEVYLNQSSILFDWVASQPTCVAVVFNSQILVEFRGLHSRLTFSTSTATLKWLFLCATLAPAICKSDAEIHSTQTTFSAFHTPSVSSRQAGRFLVNVTAK